MNKFTNWFKRNKKALLLIAAVTCPPAAVYIQTADVAIQAVEVLAEPEQVEDGK